MKNNYLYKKILIYYRLTRINQPIGIFLLLWPTLWALWLATSGFPPKWIISVFIVGVFLMRTAGCVINDCMDCKFDLRVKRTAKRPFPNGEITKKEAYVLFFILALLSFFLVLNFNTKTIFLSIVAIPLIWIYPLMKRYTYLPQIVLGIAFSWPILMVFSAVNQPLSLSGWLMILTNILWVVSYDTQYAMIDRNDDLKIGIKSTAILFDHYDRLIIGIFQTSVLFTMIIIGYLNSFKKEFYWMVIIAELLFLYQQKLLINRNPSDCLKSFKNNNYVGLIFFLGFLINYWL